MYTTKTREREAPPRINDKLLKARAQKMQEAKPVQEPSRQINQILLGKSFPRCRKIIDMYGLEEHDVRKWNSEMLTITTAQDNLKLINFKLDKQKLTDDENRKWEEIGQLRLSEYQRQQKEVELQKKIEARSCAEYRKRQIREKELLREKQLEQENKEKEMLLGHIQQLAQEQVRRTEKEAETKRRNMKCQQDDLSRQRANRQREMELDRKAEQKAQRDCLELEKQSLQKRSLQSEGVKNRQIRQKIVHDQLAALKKEQANTTAARLPPISVHSQNVILENEMEKKAKRQSHVDQLQDDREKVSKLEAREPTEKVLQQLNHEYHKTLLDPSSRRQEVLQKMRGHENYLPLPPISKAAKETSVARPRFGRR